MKTGKILLALPAAILLGLGAVYMTRSDPVIMVYKDPNCGCCAKWADHLKANGFTVNIQETNDVAAIKQKLGVPDDLQSCHTATVDGYALEGHVPADDIKKLLAERPEAKGLAVPGMPAGSPGMEIGTRADPYDVVMYDETGKQTALSAMEQKQGHEPI